MDVEEIPVCDNLSFLVYWKILAIGKGPAVVLKAFDKEILSLIASEIGMGTTTLRPTTIPKFTFLKKLFWNRLSV